MRKLPIEIRFGLRGNRENHKEPTPVQLYHKIKSRGKTVVYMFFLLRNPLSCLSDSQRLDVGR